MQLLTGIPVSIILLIIQTSVISRLNIAYGMADIVMLSLIAWALNSDLKNVLILMVFNGVLMSIVSASPLYTPLIGYAAIVGIALYLRKRLWNTPLLLMILLAFIGTLITLIVSMLAINLSSVEFSMADGFIKVILPSAAMNMVLSIPTFLILRDVWVSFFAPEPE